MLNTDQFLIERAINSFPQKMLQEGDIQFAPTFKRVKAGKPIHSSGYESVFDISKNRTPSWTDRILYGCKDLHEVNKLELINYDANNTVTLGDHRPVFAQFLFTFDTGGYNMVTEEKKVSE